MVRTILLVLAVFFVLPLQAFSQPTDPIITKTTNGVTVILQEDHATQLVGVDIWVKAGSSNETTANSGVSHFIEHLAFGTTGKRQPGDMDREIESLGGTLDAHTSRDWAHFNTTVSSRYLSKAIDILADAVTDAQYHEQDVQHERMVILDEIANKEAEPFKYCEDALAKELYRDHSYALPVEGTPETVKKLTLADIADYYHKHYVASNIAVIVVGDFDKSQVLADLNKAFQGLPNAAPIQTPQAAFTPLASPITRSILHSFKLDYLAIGFAGPRMADTKDTCAMDVLITYLGLGYRSWMSDELKDKLGVVVNANADFLTQREPGLIALTVGTQSANVDKAKTALFAELAKLRAEGLPAESIEPAKRSVLGDFAFQKETFGGRANTLGFYSTIGDASFAQTYPACINAVTNEDVIRVAQKYLDPNRAVVLTVGADQGGTK